MKIEDLKPAFVDKNGPAFHEADVLEIQAKHIAAGGEFGLDLKDVYAKSVRAMDDGAELLKAASSRYMMLAENVSENAKKVSGRVRTAAEDLANGLAKCEKQANFDRLDRYVQLLERAAQAMSILAELEKTGKLEKISSALK